MEGHIGIVRCLRLKGDILISAGDRKRVIVWNINVRILMCIPVSLIIVSTLLFRMVNYCTQCISNKL